MMSRLLYRQPRLRGVRLPGVGPGPWRRLLVLAVSLAIALWLLAALAHRAGDAVTRHSTGPGLGGGYSGEPVIAVANGERTGALGGLCEVVVRDVSSSVTDQIDPSMQLDKEIITVFEAVADTASAADLGTAVVFADSAQRTGPLPLGDAALRDRLLGRLAGSGTSFAPAFAAAEAALRECPASTTPHVTLVSDGWSAPDDVAAALAELDADVRLDVVALGGEEAWSEVAEQWRRANTEVHVVERLEAGVVAEIVASVLSFLTGHQVITGFAGESLSSIPGGPS